MQELEEEITRILTGDDPSVPKNVCKFSFKDRCYKPDPPGQSDNMAIHFSEVGTVMHVDSDEWKKYQKDDAITNEHIVPGTDQVSSDVQMTSFGSGDSSSVTCTCQGKNQFNYSDRATQTFNNPLRSQGMVTSPPPVTQFTDQVNQWAIFDGYKSACLISMMEHKQEGVLKSNTGFEDKLASIISDKEEILRDGADMMHSESMENALKILGRLVNQNAEDEIFQDFKYYEDRADSIQKGQGTLLPLWRFFNDKTSRKQVTSLCWNPRYHDLFAVGYGSYEFTRQSTGMICCYSLKNTSHPEHVIGTESGVMCLDFHQNHPSLVVVGCYDGTVSVYDIRNGSNKPVYLSSIRSGKHSDPVWQVRWCVDRSSNEAMNFYSISSDGKVAIWTMSKNDLKMEPVMLLKHNNFLKEDLDEPALTGLAGGCSIDFNTSLDSLFLVGTEAGNIHECSKAYSGQYIKSYDGHHMAVYTVQWNPFHEDIFISCSADWTIKVSRFKLHAMSQQICVLNSFVYSNALKLWDHKSPQCLLHFDLGNAVGDVCWSPYSSTVFAAVTTDGRVHIFDLAQNKREPLCCQKVVKKARLTKVSFNPIDYILVVGDDRGGVHSLKLSPNLRQLPHVDNEKSDDELKVSQKREFIRLLSSIDKKYTL